MLVIFVSGNHDEFARRYEAHNFGGVDVMEECILVTRRRPPALGHPRRFFRRRHPMHQMAGLCRRHRLRVHLEGEATLQPHARTVGLPYWHLSRDLKLTVKRAVSYLGNLKLAVACEERERAVHGLVAR